MSGLCALCGARIELDERLFVHLRVEHPDLVRRLECDNGPLEGQIAAAPIIDHARDGSGWSAPSS